MQATDGLFWGVTSNGGANGDGTLFVLSAGLGPFVKTVPILGTDLAGATSVTFNGTAAAFTIVSPSLITTRVPGGAATGKVRVTTPNGALSSNIAFQVLP